MSYTEVILGQCDTTKDPVTDVILDIQFINELSGSLVACILLAILETDLSRINVAEEDNVDLVGVMATAAVSSTEHSAPYNGSDSDDRALASC
jgi:hypothetical protein